MNSGNGSFGNGNYQACVMCLRETGRMRHDKNGRPYWVCICSRIFLHDPLGFAGVELLAALMKHVPLGELRAFATAEGDAAGLPHMSAALRAFEANRSEKPAPAAAETGEQA